MDDEYISLYKRIELGIKYYKKKDNEQSLKH